MGNSKLTRQIRTEKRAIIQINKKPVRTKLNNHIRLYSDLKCTYETEPLKIDCYILQSSNPLFS